MSSTDNPDLRLTAALALLRAGEATQAEVAELAGTSRQLVRYWCIRDGIDVQTARTERLKRLWSTKFG